MRFLRKLFGEPDPIEFSGIVRALRGDRTTALVEIQDGGDGCRFAVINSDTAGRDALLTQAGIVQLGAVVRGFGRRRDTSFVATKVSRSA